MKRQMAGCVLAALLVVGCGGDPGIDSGDSSESPSGQQASTSAIALPKTPAGRQLSWFLQRVADGKVPEAAYERKFADQFKAQLPHKQMQRMTAELRGLKPVKVLKEQEQSLVVLAIAGGQQLEISIQVNSDAVIEGLLLKPHQKPPAPPESWSALEARLNEVAPEVGFLAAELTKDGRCIPVHAVDPDTPRPVGSMFKLYVLDTVARQIEQGRLSWDTALTVRAQDKSLPSGELQNRPDGTKVTVAEAARLMISISDNTATDLLIRTVGRGAVEQTIERTSGHSKANVPLLTTRELFLLKGVEYPKYAEAYLDLPAGKRAAWLNNTLGDLDLNDHEMWRQPRNTQVVEWFAAPNDVCAAYAELIERDGVDEALSVNDGGLELDSKQWPKVWFKGGSEPGVLALGYLAEATDGSRYVFTVMAEDPERALDESTATLELLSLLEGASRLASAPS